MKLISASFLAILIALPLVGAARAQVIDPEVMVEKVAQERNGPLVTALKEQGADDIVIDFELKELDLTEHQKLMLQPVEARMANIIAPGSLASRVTRKRSNLRKNKWAEKFKGHHVGKFANK